MPGDPLVTTSGVCSWYLGAAKHPTVHWTPLHPGKELPGPRQWCQGWETLTWMITWVIFHISAVDFYLNSTVVRGHVPRARPILVSVLYVFDTVCATVTVQSIPHVPSQAGQWCHSPLPHPW